MWDAGANVAAALRAAAAEGDGTTLLINVPMPDCYPTNEASSAKIGENLRFTLSSLQRRV